MDAEEEEKLLRGLEPLFVAAIDAQSHRNPQQRRFVPRVSLQFLQNRGSQRLVLRFRGEGGEQEGEHGGKEAFHRGIGE